MWLIAGLGNPEKRYEKTRHNAGTRAVDAVAALLGSDGAPLAWRAKFGGRYADAKIGRAKVVLLRSADYAMNQSGVVLRQAAAFWKVAPKRIILVYDDKDIPVGAIRIRAEGSAGGHNGVRSVIEQLGTQKFPRVRIGIGSPRASRADAADFVLGVYAPDEREAAAQAEQRAAEAAIAVVRDGIDAAMNRYNS